MRKFKTTHSSRSEGCATRKFLRRSLQYGGKAGHVRFGAMWRMNPDLQTSKPSAPFRRGGRRSGRPEVQDRLKRWATAELQKRMAALAEKQFWEILASRCCESGGTAKRV